MKPKTLGVLQITDTHLLADPSATLRGYPTERSLQAVLRHIWESESEQDLLLATGDLAHDGAVGSYERLKAHLSRLGIPVHCLPGNHDDPGVMDSILRADWLDCTSILDRGNWRIILLDSVVPGRDGGLLGEGELTRLEIALQERPTQHALIALHHHPVPMAAPPMDNIGLENADRLWAIIDRHANVRGVLWGHIHNEFTGQYRECLLLGTPSTCFQFRLGAEQITIADRPPAYRRLVLASDGDIRTEVVEVPVAFQAGGCDRGGR